MNINVPACSEEKKFGNSDDLKWKKKQCTAGVKQAR